MMDRVQMDRVQDTGRRLCRVVRTESSKAEFRQDQRDGDRLQEEEDAFAATMDQREGGGRGGGLQIPGSGDRHQTGLEI